MRKVQLYINDQRVDLFDDEVISLTQTIKNIRDVSRVFTDFSRSFTLPASKSNNKIFQHYENFFIVGFDSRTKISARIEIDDVPFREGKIRLDGVELNKNRPYAYKVTFFGNTVTLKDLFGEEKLSALTTLDSLSQPYTSTLVKASLQLDPTTNDLVAPLITHTQRLFYDSSSTTAQTGNLYNSGSNHGVAWNQLKYALRVHKIIEAIESRYGLTFSNDFFTSSNAVYYNLFMWLHRNKGEVTSIDEQEQFTKLIDGWSTVDNTGSFSTSSTLTLKDQTWTNLTLTLTRASSTPYNISITRNGVQVYAQSGITSGNYPIDLLFAAQDYASYQVTISYSSAITFTGITWSVNYSGAASPETYNTGSFSAPASFEFVITDQIPEIKVIDFLTGLFKMFNLTAELSGTTIIVKDLDTYYADGTVRDITPYIDTESHEVNATIPYREISFKYQDTQAIIAANHNKLTGQEWAEESYNSTDDIKEGESFTVEVPFAHFKYERMINASTSATTDIQWGYAVDSNEDSYIGQPLLFYPILNSHAGILFVDEVDSLGDFTVSSSITADIIMPSNSVSFDPLVSPENINFKYEKNEYTRDLSFSATLFNAYYLNYIASIFSKQRRLSKFKAQLPVSFLLNYSLADTLTISDKEYYINSITTNLSTGQSDLELLNVIDAVFEISGGGDGNGETPGTLTVDVTGQSLPIESTTYTYNATVGGTATGTPTYAWTVNNGVINGSATNSSASVTWNAVTENSPGWIKCTVTKGSLPAVADQLNVTIQNVVAAFTIEITEGGSTTLTTPVTEGDTATYGIQTTGDTTNVTYSWSVSGGTITSGQGTSSINVTWDTPTTSGFVQVNAFRNVTEFLASDNEAIVVNAAAAPTFDIQITNVTSPVLEEDVVTYGTSVSGTATGAITYSWTVVGGSFSGQGTDSITVTWDTPGTGSVRVDAVREGVGDSDQETVEVTALETTATITGDFTDIPEGYSRSYGSSVGGNTTGTITYLWAITNGTITSGQGTANVDVTWGSAGGGSLELYATRQGRTGYDFGSITMLPFYFRFERCSDGLFVWQDLVSEPSLNDLYTDGVDEYIYIGPPTTQPGTIVTNLSGPIGSGCTPPPPPPSTLSITGDQDIATAGQSGVDYTLLVDPDSVQWLLTDAALSGFNPIDITFVTSTSGTGDTVFTVNFGAYNGNGTETLRSVITATEQNPTAPNPASSGSIVISQSPPPPTTYYIFNACDSQTWADVMIEAASEPTLNQRAVGGTSNYYTYSGTTTTDPNAYAIATLTLQAETGCPAPPSCTTYQALNEGSSSSTFGYNDCTSGAFRTFTLQSGESRSVCALNGTFAYESGDTNYTITELGSC